MDIWNQQMFVKDMLKCMRLNPRFEIDVIPWDVSQRDYMQFVELVVRAVVPTPTGMQQLFVKWPVPHNADTYEHVVDTVKRAVLAFYEYETNVWFK